jgi:hypothetical protein
MPTFYEFYFGIAPDSYSTELIRLRGGIYERILFVL